jgi:DNA-directed RNA polymerase specialized sigma24 family protein
MGGTELAGDDGSAVGSLYRAHYRSLVRLAALLTADVPLAEDIAADCLAALINSAARAGTPDRALLLLRRRVVLRCRHATRQDAGSGVLQASGVLPASEVLPASGILQALRSLPCGQREAVILRHYLQLSEQETAAVMGASRRVVRRMAAVSEAFLALLTHDPPASQAP